MFRYKNLSLTTKTFYGVTFKPGEEHDVPGYINVSKFIRVDTKEVSKKHASAASTIKKDEKKLDNKKLDVKSESKIDDINKGGNIDG